MSAQEMWENKVEFVLCWESYSPKQMASVLPRIHRLGFERIATHVGFCKVNGGLRNNTIYFKCEFEGRRDIKGALPSTKVVCLELHNRLMLEGTYSKHPSIDKDFIFMLRKTNKVGWYNRERNILWLPDLLHFPISQEKEGWVALDKVLEAIA